jgi:hypothetical protein
MALALHGGFAQSRSHMEMQCEGLCFGKAYAKADGLSLSISAFCGADWLQPRVSDRISNSSSLKGINMGLGAHEICDVRHVTLFVMADRESG